MTPDPARDFGELRALVDEYLFFAVALDGIVVDSSRAEAPFEPCRCVDVPKANGETTSICFKRGVIGTLTRDQVRDLCATRIPLRHPEGIERRVREFQQAADECSGMKPEARLGCMSGALRSRGITFGSP